MTANSQSNDLPFKPAHQPFGQHGAPVCQYASTSQLTLRREDNLGRPLAFRDGGNATDSTGKSVSADITDRDIASFQKLALGEVRWQWQPSVTGEHLIGVKTVSEQRYFTPGKVMNELVSLEIIPGGRRATAIHLPPAVMINLREEMPSDQLTKEQLAYFQNNGNNALIYIHGYNVDHGEWGRFLKDSTPVGPGQQAILSWHNDTPSTVWQDAQSVSNDQSAHLEPDDINGSGAHNWAINMEYQLNRAAGFDGEDWMPYSRIINVSWPGNTGTTDFIQAEFNAMSSGRRLVGLFQQLQGAGIAINVITHSLGARVALTALNILATLQRTDIVDHLFLWEPAVADNALSNDPENDVHPLGLGVFPAAHRAARQIVILHSRGDGILGPDADDEQSLWKRALNLVPFATAGSTLQGAWGIVTADDPMDELLAKFHGAYDKKWWTFPGFIDNGLAPYIEELYKDYLPLTYSTSNAGNAPRLAQQTRINEARSNWRRLEQDILAEAAALQEHCIRCLRNAEKPPEYRLLAPLNHRASVSIDTARNYIKQLKQLAQNNWYPTQKPRPALGYAGLDEITGNEAGKSYDAFIDKQLAKEKFQVVNQSDWLFSHSGMRIPSEDIFQRSFVDAIMERLTKGGVGFGRY